MPSVTRIHVTPNGSVRVNPGPEIYQVFDLLHDMKWHAAERAELERQGPGSVLPQIRLVESNLPLAEQEKIFEVALTRLQGLARGIARASVDREEEPWRFPLYEEFLQRHWYLGDEREVYNYISLPADTPEQKSRQLRHFRRRRFAAAMWYSLPDMEKVDLFLYGSEEEVEADLEEYLAQHGGNRMKTNASIRRAAELNEPWPYPLPSFPSVPTGPENVPRETAPARIATEQTQRVRAADGEERELEALMERRRLRSNAGTRGLWR